MQEEKFVYMLKKNENEELYARGGSSVYKRWQSFSTGKKWTSYSALMLHVSNRRIGYSYAYYTNDCYKNAIVVKCKVTIETVEEKPLISYEEEYSRRAEKQKHSEIRYLKSKAEKAKKEYEQLQKELASEEQKLK